MPVFPQLPHVEHGSEGDLDGSHLVWRCGSHVLIEPGTKHRFDGQE
jgi:hypothetical protein